MTLYLDTSSLLKLYVEEEGSEDVRALVSRAAVVATSRVAYPEARAALARRLRERRLGPSAFTHAKRTFDDDWGRYVVVELTSSVCADAGTLVEKFRRRAYDSIHLASFAQVAREAGPKQTEFSSFDAPLERAARSLARTLLDPAATRIVL